MKPQELEVDPLPSVRVLEVIQLCATCKKENAVQLPPKSYGEAMRLWNETWYCPEHKPGEEYYFFDE